MQTSVVVTDMSDEERNKMEDERRQMEKEREEMKRDRERMEKVRDFRTFRVRRDFANSLGIYRDE